MDSFILNTTAADHFGIFEVNGPVSCNSEIQGLLRHLRQQGGPCSIDMIEWYGTSEHFDWFLMLEMDSFTLNTTAPYHFGIFDGSVATNKLSVASLHLSVLQQIYIASEFTKNYAMSITQ